MIDLPKLTYDLSSLFTITGVDWVLTLSYILTEPVVPTAIITPERWHISRYRVDCNSLEESLERAIVLVRREIIGRTVVGSYAPYSNPDDDAFAKWLHARAAGSDARLPDLPGRHLPEHYEWVADGFLAKHRDWILSPLEPKSDSKAFRLPRGDVASYIAARIGHFFRDERIDYEAARAMIEAKIQAMKDDHG